MSESPLACGLLCPSGSCFWQCLLLFKVGSVNGGSGQLVRRPGGRWQARRKIRLPFESRILVNVSKRK